MVSSWWRRRGLYYFTPGGPPARMNWSNLFMWLPWLIFTKGIQLLSKAFLSHHESCRQPETRDGPGSRRLCQASGASLRQECAQPLTGQLCPRRPSSKLCQVGVVRFPLLASPPHEPITTQLPLPPQDRTSAQASLWGSTGTWPQRFRFGSIQRAFQIRGVRFRPLTLAANGVLFSLGSNHFTSID